ncbi:MAG: serine protease [Pseudonocardiaceae bacterium]|nr:serine protease [Pseudonocardiaceae bacterium]
MRVRIARRAGFVASLALAMLAAVLLPSPAVAAPQFAAADEATVQPGVVTNTEGAECTSNFIFTDGTDVFIGMAAHCAGTGPATATDGCTSESRRLGTEVAIDGASQPGTLVYSSWLAMQDNGEDDVNACTFNDFALVELDPADVSITNPSVLSFGGPTGLDTDGTESGETVYSYGNSPLRGGVLQEKTGVSTGTTGGGWSHQVVTVTPGIPGDSGSGFLDADGEAFGVLSTLAIAPLPGSNGVTDLAMALDYANTHGGLGEVSLVEGTEPFAPSLLPLGL